MDARQRKGMKGWVNLMKTCTTDLPQGKRVGKEGDSLVPVELVWGSSDRSSLSLASILLLAGRVYLPASLAQPCLRR